MSDQPQTFIAYNWGVYAQHRWHIAERADGTKVAVMPKIQKVAMNQFGFGSMIFPRGRFPGRYLAQLS